MQKKCLCEEYSVEFVNDEKVPRCAGKEKCKIASKEALIFFGSKSGLDIEGLGRETVETLLNEKIKETNLNKSENQKIENISDKNINKLIKELEKEMKNAAKILEFEKAALLRDQITELRKNLIDKRN